MSHTIAVAEAGRAPGELWHPRGLAIDTSTNQIYLTEGGLDDSARISIFSDTGDFLSCFSHHLLRWPWGIALHRDNIYVSDLKGQLIFQFNAAAHFCLICKQGSAGSSVGQFNQPRQITISHQGEVFVADCKNHRVQILDSQLHYRRFISHHSMTRPYDVKLTQNEVYILSDTDSPCVHVFSHAGDKISSLITRGDIGKDVVCSWFFCLQPNKNLIISDCSAHQVKIFSKDGILLHTLGEQGHEVGLFNFPCGIAITDKLKLLVVSENRNYRLQILFC